MRLRLTKMLYPVAALCLLGFAACTDESDTGTYSGYYRQGFEQSDFYTRDGQGPWWVDAGEPEWEQFMAHVVPASGRGSAATLRMTVEGQLMAGGGFGHLGQYDKRLFVTRIVDIEPVSAEHYHAVIAGFHASPATD